MKFNIIFIQVNKKKIKINVPEIFSGKLIVRSIAETQLKDSF